MKEIIPVSCCPWCKELPKFEMFFTDRTWLPVLHCKNEECSVNPKSKYVPIRKRQRYDAQELRVRINKMILLWNRENPFPPISGFEFDFEEIATNEAKRKL